MTGVRGLLGNLPKGGWSYRALRHVQNGEEHFQIHEVYYDATGKIRACTQNEIAAFGETKEELMESLRMMLRDCERSVVDYDKIPEKGAKDFGEDRPEKRKGIKR